MPAHDKPPSLLCSDRYLPHLSIGMITRCRHGNPRFDEHADAAL